MRAGVVTPQVSDEIAVREGMGLPEISEEAIRLWDKQGAVRQPITLQSGVEASAEVDSADDPNDNGE